MKVGPTKIWKLPSCTTRTAGVGEEMDLYTVCEMETFNNIIFIYIYIIYTPGTQMTHVLVKKGLVLWGSRYIYTYIYIYDFMCKGAAPNMCI